MKAALVSVLLLVGAQQACAQETGTRISNGTPAQIRGDEEEANRLTLFEFGNCAVRRRDVAARELLAMSLSSPNYSRELARLADSECLEGGSLRMSPILMRGAIAEAVFRSRFQALETLDVSGLPEIDYFAGVNSETTARVRTALGYAAFGDCLVRADPAAALTLLRVRPASDAEEQPMARMIELLGPCLTAGQTMAFNRPMIRAAVAEGALTLATARANNRFEYAGASQP